MRISITPTISSVQRITWAKCNLRTKDTGSIVRKNYTLHANVHIFKQNCSPSAIRGPIHRMWLCTPSNRDNLVNFPHEFIFSLFLVRHNLQRRRQHPNLCIQCPKGSWITVIILHAQTKDSLELQWMVKKKIRHQGFKRHYLLSNYDYGIFAVLVHEIPHRFLDYL